MTSKQVYFSIVGITALLLLPVWRSANGEGGMNAVNYFVATHFTEYPHITVEEARRRAALAYRRYHERQD